MATLRNSIVGRGNFDDEKTIHPSITINDIEPVIDNTPDYKRAAIAIAVDCKLITERIKSETQKEYVWQTVQDERVAHVNGVQIKGYRELTQSEIDQTPQQ